MMEKERGRVSWEIVLDILEFYSPEAIAERQARWKKEAEEEAEWARRNEAKASASKSFSPPPPVETAKVPDEHSQEEGGGFVRAEKIGRNDPCPCGSGKKYKKCCGANG